MNRDNKGRFCSDNENELVQQIGSKKTYLTDLHKNLMDNCFGNDYFTSIKNENPEEASKYTIGVKIVAFYDVDVRANSPEEAIEKISEMNSYKLLTEEIPVDSRDPVFSWLALQDE